MSGLRLVSGRPMPGLSMKLGGVMKPVRSVPPRKNLALNPSVEDGTLNGGFFSAAGAGSGISQDWANTGIYSVKGVASGSASGDYRLTGSSQNTFPAGFEPGKTYRVSAYTYCPAAITLNNRSRRILFFYSVNGVQFIENFGPQGTAAAGVQRLSHTCVIPANATGIIVGVGIASNVAGNLTYVDSILIEETTELREYFDGSTPRTRDYVHSWGGTPNASVSIATP